MDITMCRDETCEKREKCYRYTAPVDRYWQSVFSEPPEKPCIHFWNNDGKRDGRTVGQWWEDK